MRFKRYLLVIDSSDSSFMSKNQLDLYRKHCTILNGMFLRQYK